MGHQWQRRHDPGQHTHANADHGHGGNRRPLQGIQRHGEGLGVERPGHCHRHPCRQPKGHHSELSGCPPVGTVATAIDATTRHDQPHRQQRNTHRQHREAQKVGGPNIQHGVHPHANTHQTHHHGNGGHHRGGCSHVTSAPVAAGVHGCGQIHRPLQGTLEHRHGQTPQTTNAPHGTTPQAPGLAHPAGGEHRLGNDGQGNRQRHADFVQHRRHGAQQPVGIGQRVCRPERRHDGGQAQALNGSTQQHLNGDGATDVHPGSPFGQLGCWQGEQHHAGDAQPEQCRQHHPQHHDEGPQPQRQRERPAPWSVGAAGSHHPSGHSDEKAQHQRVGGAHGSSGHACSPQPPCQRVDSTGTTPPATAAGSRHAVG